MIKLFAMDIDHTLYSSELGYIPQRNIDAVKALMDTGVTVCLASSRDYVGVQPVAQLFDLKNHNGYVAVNNGAYVVSLSDGRVLANECFSFEEIESFYEYSKVLGTGFNMMVDNTTVANDFGQINTYNFKHVDMDLLLTSNPLKYAHGGNIRQCGFFDDNRNMYEFYNTIDEQLKEKYNFNVPQRTVMDVALKHVNKFFGVSKVAEELGITADEIATMGDNDNDIPMLKGAGISACVGNGSENAKKAATYVVASDKECGVAEFIEKYLLKGE